MAFYLTGSFNAWRPDDQRYRFHEVTQPYGDPRKDLTLSLGSHFLETDLQQGEIQFKIVEDGSWNRQWSINNSPDVAGKIDKGQFNTRHGLKPNYIIYRGGGQPPHAEYDYPGGRMRWDFHPESRTLTIHSEHKRSTGMRVKPWKWFDCGDDIVFNTYVCYPYGYDSEGVRQCSTAIVFDGRGHLYGEDSNFNVWNEPRRQWPRAMDALARHGLITPPVVVGVEPPHTRNGKVSYRGEAYRDTRSTVHQRYTRTICTHLLPRIREVFRVLDDPSSCCLLGHSNGADIALTLVTRHPDLFGGVVAFSPGGAGKAVNLPPEARSRVRIALAYGSIDLNTEFVTGTANTASRLEENGIQHLVHYMPDVAHDPVDLHRHLHACFAYAMR